MIETRPLNSLPMSLHPQWGSASFRSALIAIFMLMLSVAATGAAFDTTSSQIQKRKGKPLRCFVDVGSVMGIHSPDFFRDYKRYLTGVSSTFNAPEIIRVGVGSYQLSNIAAGLTGGYYRAVVRETYQFRPELLDVPVQIPSQTLTQELIMTAFPTMVTADYVPLGRQFTSYVGAGIGLNIVNITWREDISTSQAPGARTSGERYGATHMAPSVMIRSGVSLGLDKLLSSTTSAAIHIEASYTYSSFSAPLLERLAPRFASVDRLSSPYRVSAGGLGIHAGLSFFLR